MSGIYIKGIEMPKSCHFCELFEADLYWCCAAKKDIEAISDYENRSTFCPIVPVPDHGRLIDADALRQSIKESVDECHKWANEVEGGEMYARVSQALGTFVECSLRVKAAPTIIPADKEVDYGE